MTAAHGTGFILGAAGASAFFAFGEKAIQRPSGVTKNHRDNQHIDHGRFAPFLMLVMKIQATVRLGR
jgi:hypothetical protein